jgi:hypothetical protein
MEMELHKTPHLDTIYPSDSVIWVLSLDRNGAAITGNMWAFSLNITLSFRVMKIKYRHDYFSALLMHVRQAQLLYRTSHLIQNSHTFLLSGIPWHRRTSWGKNVISVTASIQCCGCVVSVFHFPQMSWFTMGNLSSSGKADFSLGTERSTHDQSQAKQVIQPLGHRNWLMSVT